jgi:hypothetical protein
VTYHTTSLQLGEFTVPELPTGYRVESVTVCDTTRTWPSSERREKTFTVEEQKRYESDKTQAEKALQAINLACEHVLEDIGWGRAEITLDLVGDGLPAKRMIYTGRNDNWDTETDEIDIIEDDPEAVQIGVMPTVAESEQPTNVIVVHPLFAELVTDAEAMPID